MIQPQTQTRRYWEKDFKLNDTHIEQLYTHFLESGRPHTTAELTRVIMQQQVSADINAIKRRLSGRAVYQPKASYAIGDELVFPNMAFAQGTISDIRDGYNPQEAHFKVVTVDFGDKKRQFAADLDTHHEANVGDGGVEQFIELGSTVDVYEQYGFLIEDDLLALLQGKEDFIYLGGKWFVKALLADINIGHLHLAEAVMDMFGGGPVKTEDILPHLELDSAIPAEVQAFSLNYAMLNDSRFDEIAPKGQVAWFLRRLEPEFVQTPTERLSYEPIAYDDALLSPSLLQLERELVDEWSEYSVSYAPSTLRFSLIYPHRLMGTLPLSAQLSAMLPLGRSERQLFTGRDVETGKEMPLWVVKKARYVYGLLDWYNESGVPVGGYITLRLSDDPSVLLLDCHQRRPQREDVRLATISDTQVKFSLSRRSVSCQYDDLMVVGTEYTSAIDGLWSRFRDQKRSLVSIVALILPELANLTPQGTVHAKTLYSAVNMVFRVPPAPLFAALVRHPAFVAVGDHYWMFDSSRWQRG